LICGQERVLALVQTHNDTAIQPFGAAVPGRYRDRLTYLKYASSQAAPTLQALAVADSLERGGYDHCIRLNCALLWRPETEAALAELGRLSALQGAPRSSAPV